MTTIILNPNPGDVPASTDNAGAPQANPANVILSALGGFTTPGVIQRIGTDSAGRLPTMDTDYLIQLIAEIRVLQVILFFGLNVNEVDIDQVRADAVAELTQETLPT